MSFGLRYTLIWLPALFEIRLLLKISEFRFFYLWQDYVCYQARLRIGAFSLFLIYFWGTEFCQHTFLALVSVIDWLCYLPLTNADYCSWWLSRVQCLLHVKHNIGNLNKQSWITAIFSACIMQTNEKLVSSSEAKFKFTLSCNSSSGWFKPTQWLTHFAWVPQCDSLWRQFLLYW